MGSMHALCAAHSGTLAHEQAGYPREGADAPATCMANVCGGGMQARDKPKKDVFECPAYRVKKRTGLNFISTFSLRTEDPKNKWILRGAALLCSKD